MNNSAIARFYWVLSVILGLSLLAPCSVEASKRSKAAKARREKRAKRTEAFSMYRRSRELFKEGRFQDSAVLLRQAYELSEEPILKFNLGRSLEAAGELDEAVEAYRVYLEKAPRAKDRKEVEARMEKLQQQLLEREKRLASQLEKEQKLRDEAEEKERQRQVKIREERRENQAPSWLPWAVAGVGGAGLVAGGILGYLSIDKRQAAENAGSQVEAFDLQNSSDDFGVGAIVALAAGGTLAAAGITWGILDLVGKSEDPPSASEPKVSLRLGSTSIALAGSW